MGKQISVLSVKGKVGNVVGYTYLDSKLNKAAGLRVYQGDVKNPQSDAQARQRARLLPLTSFYRFMKEVITRGYQEAGYGQPSRRLFMRDNMKSFEGPWLTKGTVAAIPGPFIISRGSLVPITVTSVSATAATTDLGVGASPTLTTIGGLSSALMANNSDIQVGDQLTFIMGSMVSGSVPSVIYRYKSIVVSPDDSSALPFTASAASQVLLFSVGLLSDEVAVCAAVIQSRDGGSTHLRSFAQIAVNSTALGAYYGTSAVNSAIASYQTNDSTNDWPVEVFDNGNASNPINIGSFSFVGLVTGPDNGVNHWMLLVDGNGGQVLVRNMVTGSAFSGRYLGQTSWTAAEEQPSGLVIMEITDNTVLTNLQTWLVDNYGYSRGVFEW